MSAPISSLFRRSISTSLYHADCGGPGQRPCTLGADFQDTTLSEVWGFWESGIRGLQELGNWELERRQSVESVVSGTWGFPDSRNPRIPRMPRIPIRLHQFPSSGIPESPIPEPYNGNAGRGPRVRLAALRAESPARSRALAGRSRCAYPGGTCCRSPSTYHRVHRCGIRRERGRGCGLRQQGGREDEHLGRPPLRVGPKPSTAFTRKLHGRHAHPTWRLSHAQ
jgi:hypothetical protein